ncbi:MAG: cation-translocating P-type ATPase [Fimbriimonadaceae bacterium]|nr:cation-translocating P-type ATPase [Fimbriimonadaceae bacterium]
MATAPRQASWAVSGLDCPVCAKTLEGACAGLPGVLEVRANPATGKLYVVHDEQLSLGDLAAAARRAGHPLQTTAAPVGTARDRWGLAAALLLAGSVLLEAGGGPAVGGYWLATALGGWPLLPAARSAARQRQLDINGLMALAMAGALALGDAHEAALLAVLFALAQHLERRAARQGGRAVEALLAATPATALVEQTAGLAAQPVDAIAVGAVLRLRPGDRVALDGSVLEGLAWLDEATVTGESHPVTKEPGSPVYSGTTVVDGTLRVEVTRAAADSTLAQVARLVEEAQLRAAPTARLVDRFARWYTPLVVLLALLTIVGGVWAGLGWAASTYRALCLLVIGCPCAIVIATPVAIQSGLTAAARSGLLLRGGEVLEAVGELQAVAFDKTGTLTAGSPTVAGLHLLRDDYDEADLWAVAAALESASAHPLAAAFAAAPAAPLAVTQFRTLPGRGLTGVLAGGRWHLGNLALLAEAGIDPAAAQAAARAVEAAGDTAIVLADDRPQAVFAVRDALRPSAAAAVAELHTLGLTTTLLTGDQPAPAAAVARLVGIRQWQAALRPEAKQAALHDLTAQHGGVAMVGDGLNDAPALAAATVGIALGTAAAGVAREAADVGLLGSDLTAIPRLIRLARAVRRTIRWNLALAIGLRLVLVPLAIGGQASLWLAILGDLGGSLAVTANSLRLLRPARRDQPAAD